MNPKDKEQEKDKIINEFWNEMEQLDCPFSYTMNELIVKVYQQAKQEERERILGIINKIWLEQLKIDSSKWKGKDKGNEVTEGYLIFTNNDVKRIIEQINSEANKK